MDSSALSSAPARWIPNPQASTISCLQCLVRPMANRQRAFTNGMPARRLAAVRHRCCCSLRSIGRVHDDRRAVPAGARRAHAAVLQCRRPRDRRRGARREDVRSPPAATSTPGLGSPPATSAAPRGSRCCIRAHPLLTHLHRHETRPRHICTTIGLAPGCRICGRTGLAPPHLRWECARPRNLCPRAGLISDCRICTRAGLIP